MRPTEATKDTLLSVYIAKLTHLGQKLFMVVYPTEGSEDGNEDKDEAG